MQSAAANVVHNIAEQLKSMSIIQDAEVNINDQGEIEVKAQVSLPADEYLVLRMKLE